MLDTVGSMTFIVIGFLLIAILLRILFVVHRQGNRIKELENRMKATDEMEVTDNNG